MIFVNMLIHAVISGYIELGIILVLIQYILDKLILKVSLSFSSMKKLFVIDLVHFGLLSLLISLCSNPDFVVLVVFLYIIFTHYFLLMDWKNNL